jgi:alpha-L-fucosidase 2
MSDFFNPQGMYHNFWYNHHQSYGYSLFANAVAFTCDDEAVAITEESLTLVNKTPVALTITKTPVDATVSFVSSNVKVATVAADGKVTAVADGECIIFAINGDQTASIPVTVALAG